MSEGQESRNTLGDSKYKFFDTENFLENINAYQHLKPAVKKKLGFIRNDPFCGEPLGYKLAGFRSMDVKYRYIIIYGICKECRQHQTCCQGLGDDAVVFYAFGQHDDSYRIANKLLKKKLNR